MGGGGARAGRAPLDPPMASYWNAFLFSNIILFIRIMEASKIHNFKVPPKYLMIYTTVCYGISYIRLLSALCFNTSLQYTSH